MAKPKTDWVIRCKELGVDLNGKCPAKGSQEWTAFLNAKRQLSAKTPGKRRTRKQIEADMKSLMGKLAKEQLETVRHIAVANLVELLNHTDPKIRQSTSLAVLDRTDGKPTQVIEQTGEVVTRIVYETAAMQVPDFLPEFVPESDEVARELEQRSGD